MAGTSSRLRIGQLGLALGMAAGFAWLALPFIPAECAPPTEASEDFCNRLWTPPLAGMFTGFVALFSLVRTVLSRVALLGVALVAIGTGLMFAGNFSEYWFMNELPHDGPEGWIRSAAFMTLLFGFVVVLAGAAIVGLSTWRSDGDMRWIGMPFVAVIPAAIALAALGSSPFATLGGLAVATTTQGLARTRRAQRLSPAS